MYVAGIVIALFISALLLVKKEKSRSDKILLGWMILQAIHIAYFYLFHTEELYNFPFLLGMQLPLPLIQGVFLYLYVASMTNQLPKKKSYLALHFIPTIAIYLYMIPFFLLSTEEKIYVFKNDGLGYEIFGAVVMAGTFCSGIIYFIWSSILLQKHKKAILNQFSDTDNISLNWLRLLTYGLGLVWILVIFSQNDIIIFAGASAFVILIGFFGIQQKDIFINSKTIGKPSFQKEEIAAPKIAEGSSDKEKYAKSGLTKNTGDKKYEELIHLMQAESYYKNNQLSLNDLAEALAIHPNYLSQIINEKENKSFYDFVNAFRIEEFKRLIAIPENQQFTLLTLAYDCGFNSKSSFNRNFKKATGQTPSQYANSILKK